MEPQASEVVPVTEAAANPSAEAPVAAAEAGPPADASPPATSGGAAKRPTGRRRSRSFYGKENTDDPPAVVTLPPRAAPVRKNTGVNLESIILQLTLKESISKEIERLKELGQYEDVSTLIDVEAFDEEATQTLAKYSSPPEVKQFKFVHILPTIIHIGMLFRHSTWQYARFGLIQSAWAGSVDTVKLRASDLGRFF